MQILKSKTIAILISLLLSVSMAASMMLIPNANAHTPAWNIPTYAYIFADPNPIGVGQTSHVYMWLDMVFGAAGTAAPGQYSYALLSNTYRFHNYQLIITAPDGTNTTETFAVVSDSTSSQAYAFTPSTTGTYTLTFKFPGQAYAAYAGDYNPTSTLVGDTYLPSTASTTVTVQSTPIAVSPETPLPTNYWSYPIYGSNYAWASISSNWLGFGVGLSGSVPPEPSGYTSTTLYSGDGIGPLTSHVMWTTPTQFGGEVGGNMFTDDQSIGYFEGSSYAPRFQNPIIIDGYLYYTVVASFTGSPILGGSATGPTICVNLHTGQQLWSNKNIPQLLMGLTFEVYDPDQHGVYPPVLVAAVGNTWELFDGFTGDALFNVTNVPSGAGQWGPSGEYLQYIFTNQGNMTDPNWYLSEWNSSRLWIYDINPFTGSGSMSPSIILSDGALLGGALGSTLPVPITGESTMNPNFSSGFVPYGSPVTTNGDIGIAEGRAMSTLDSPTTYDWNLSLSWMNTLPIPAPVMTIFGPGPAVPFTVGAVDYGDMMICYSPLPSGFAAMGGGTPQAPWTMYAINLNASKGAVGSLLWSKSYTPPSGNFTISFSGADWQTRTFVMNYEETMQWTGFSLTNGAQLWGPTPSQTALDYYGTPGSPPLQGFLAYGTLYSSSYGGICYAYNDHTGKLLWTWGNGGPSQPDNSTYAGFNGPYGVYPTQIQAIDNGVVYLATDEHTVTNPIYVGATITAINATTGQQIWRLSGYPSEWASTGSAFAVAAGYLTFFNGYDGQIYSVGRGSSATTVQAPLTSISAGTSVALQGTVMDTSAGTQQSTQMADFPNGVPCASDASMQAWMGYVYQQQAEPTNFTGVTVTLTALDPNNNIVTIGQATTNAYGLYNYQWTPPNVPGKYTVTATFAGTNGYFPSSAQTTMIVGSPQATAAPTATPATGLATQATLEYIGVAIIVVIIIIGVVLALLTLRKRP